MIEIFRTNITQQSDADTILNKIHSVCPDYYANFDLADCDHILRVRSTESLICAMTIIGLIKDFGFAADILPDILPDQDYHESYQNHIRI